MSDQTWQGRSESVDDTARIGRAIARCTRAGDVVALIGALGAGKTQLVRGMAVELGVDADQVASPTYVLIHEYATGADRPVLVHIDAYRISDAADLESIGWEPGGGELAENAIVVIEWADRLADDLGPDALEVTLEHASPTERLVTMRPVGAWTERMKQLVPEVETGA